MTLRTEQRGLTGIDVGVVVGVAGFVGVGVGVGEGLGAGGEYDTIPNCFKITSVKTLSLQIQFVKTPMAWVESG